MDTLPDAVRWPLVQRVAFRFLFVYFFVYAFPFPFNVIPGLEEYAFEYQKLWYPAVPWVGANVLHLPYPITVMPNGSGDTTFNYGQVLCYAAIAATATLLWSLMDFRRPHYRRLFGWLRVYVRFDLAATMVAYGTIKVIKSQFPDPALDRLIQPFGDASPMGLLWTFMGASEGYNVFSGAGEMLGGLLLTTRRTSLLGALVSIGVMSHVVALNFCYDVPVKLFSLHLLAMAIFLAAPDARRLGAMFLWNRPAAPAEIVPITRWKVVNFGLVALRTVVVTGYVAVSAYGAIETRKMYGDAGKRSPFRGIWNVEELTEDGQTRPAVLSDLTRWRRIVFDDPQTMAIQLIGDTRMRFGLTLDVAAKTLKIRKRMEGDAVGELAYQQPAQDRLLLDGQFQGKVIKAVLRRADDQQFRLTTRGFHWINEYPFNR